MFEHGGNWIFGDVDQTRICKIGTLIYQQSVIRGGLCGGECP
jgi:hypothetical protein